MGRRQRADRHRAQALPKRKVKTQTEIEELREETGGYVNSWLICPSSRWVELLRQLNLKNSRLAPKVKYTFCAQPHAPRLTPGEQPSVTVFQRRYR
jgi:hypothetical protein